MRRKIISFLVLVVVLLATPLQAFADGLGQQDQPGVQVTDTRVMFSFADVSSNEISLVSPLSVNRLLFSVPPNLRLNSGGLVINYDVLMNGTDVARIQNGDGVFGGNLFIKFNSIIVATIPINTSGSFSQKIELPANAFDLIREDGRHILTFTFDSQVSCVYDVNAIVTLKSSSSFDLGYESTSPALNLARLPAPFYLQDSIIPDGARVVVPDDPEALELQAAMNVMAGLGSMISDNYDLQLVSIGNLSEADRAKYHLIFVGLPSKLGLLSEVDFKQPVVDGKFASLPERAVDDGVLEMALSPWNPLKAVLLVSGNTPQATLKAAYAVSTARVLIFEDPILSYVSNVQLLSQALPSVEDFSLADLGYTTQDSGVLSGVGVISREFLFFAAKNQLAARDGYIDLIYYHAGLLDYGAASFSLYLNGQVFSTILFGQESEQVTDQRIRIPPGLLRYGENRLEVRANLLQRPSCDQDMSFNPWLTISDQTKIHLPLAGDTAQPASVLRDLKFFPDLFSGSSDLGDVAFVLPKSADKWTLAGQIAYSLGETVRPALVNLAVSYGDDVPQEVLNNYSLIVIGKASELPIIASLNDQLPAPFDLSANTASERQLQISYRIPAGQNVGYLELLASPYNSEKTILLVSGNTDTGTAVASSALLLANLKDQLAGVFAVTNGTQVSSGSGLSPFSIVGDVVLGAEQVVTPLPQTPTAQFVRPAWLIPFLAVTGIAILVIVIFALISFLNRNRAHRLAEKQLTSEIEDDEKKK
jgi:hypothetical protein